MEQILEEDKNVLKQLLTTEKVVAHEQERILFGQYLSDLEREAIKKRRLQKGPSSKEQAEFNKTMSKLKGQIDRINKNIEMETDERRLADHKRNLKKITGRQKTTEKNFKNPKVNNGIAAELKGEQVYARVGRRSFANGFNDPKRTLATAPKEQRLGILTHPSWLISHSDAMDNHTIHRGIWVRERLQAAVSLMFLLLSTLNFPMNPIILYANVCV